MADYRPLPLGKLCNVGASFHGINPAPLLGKQSFHGLPFVIGAAGAKGKAKGRGMASAKSAGKQGNCYIGFDAKPARRKPVTLPIGSAATHVIFAHALLETRRDEGEAVGTVVARYMFRYADGQEVVVPIRERFEVGALPQAWGQLPFLSFPDKADHMHERYQGEYGSQGFRQTEASQAWPNSYFVWAWANPRADQPDVPIKEVVLEPVGRKFIVAGVTLSSLKEYPFAVTARREVRITLPKKADAERNFKLEIDVDRGVATYPYPLPQAKTPAFLTNPVKGWGEPLNGKSSPAYVHIAANPSATITIRHDGETLGKANWGELEAKGVVKTPRVDLAIVDSGRNWVHTTVVDDATGKPVHCRVHFRSSHGIPYQPHGHHDHLNSNQGTWHIDIGGDVRLGQISYAYIDGTCQGWLPRGHVVVDVARGFEYEPIRQIVDIKPGQREVELRLKRWSDVNAKGWYSGDTHVHFLGERGAHREAAGEDLNVVNLLASQWGHLFTNTEDFIGRPTASGDGKTIVYTTQENRQHMLGHLTLLGLKKQVAPWCTDGPSEAEMGGALETTLSHWADACHEQGGTVVIPHLPTPNGEPAALIATGRADAVEMLIHSPYAHVEYYRYLNCGYKLPLVGGTDKMSADVPVGICRTYARIKPDEPFNYDTWCAALRAGRTFLTSGPMIQLRVNGAEIGDTIDLPGNGGTVEVEARADSIFPIHTLQIVERGEVVASTNDKKGARSLTLTAKIKVSKHSWLAARCAGPNYSAANHLDGWRRGIFAHTSPIYVAVGGPWWLFDEATARYMLTLIDGSVKYIRQHGRRAHDEKGVTHHHTHADHRSFLESPLQEAAAAIHKRMHELGISH
ncbi:MAG: CehA/McbA family metallohydrolase [Planctomycetota bacterium]|nr:CehA/McbA family metallohydrolase [Planctomycetota bacterium]